MKVRVVPRDSESVFVHGKAGVIEHADGRVYSFVGSVNDSASGFRHAYEILWGDEDRSRGGLGARGVRAFLAQGVDLPDAVVKHVAAMASRIEYRSIEEARDATAPFRSTPCWPSGRSIRAGRSFGPGRSALSRPASKISGCTARRGICSPTMSGWVRPCRWRPRRWYCRCSTTSRC